MKDNNLLIRKLPYQFRYPVVKCARGNIYGVDDMPAYVVIVADVDDGDF